MEFLSPQRDFGGRWLGELGWRDSTIPLLIFGSTHSANIFDLRFIKDTLGSKEMGLGMPPSQEESTTNIKK